jgi:hypothetical protein
MNKPRIHANKEIHHRDTESTEVKIRRLHRLRRFFLRRSYRPANEHHRCSNCVSFDSSTRGGPQNVICVICVICGSSFVLRTSAVVLNQSAVGQGPEIVKNVGRFW